MPEYVSLKQVLRDLRLKENELESLVSLGEIRTFVVANELKFKAEDIQRLKQETGKTMNLGGIASNSESEEKTHEEEIQPFNAPFSAPSFTFAETAKKLRLDVHELEQCVSKGELEPVGDGPDLRFRCSDVEELMLGTGKTVLRPDPEPEPKKREANDLSFEEACKILRLDRSEFEEFIEAGQIRPTNEGHPPRFSKLDVERLANDTGSTMMVGHITPPKPETQIPPPKPSRAAPAPSGNLISFKAACRILQLRKDELKRLVDAGEIKVHRNPDGWEFDANDLRRLENDTGATIANINTASMHPESDAGSDDIAPYDDAPTASNSLRFDDEDDFAGDFQESETVPIQAQTRSLTKPLVVVGLTLALCGAALAFFKGWI